MGDLHKAEINDSMVNEPVISLDIVASDSPPAFEVTCWPLQDSDLHYSATVSADKVLSSFIEDTTIPGGTTTEKYNEEIFAVLDALEASIKKARESVGEMPLRG